MEQDIVGKITGIANKGAGITEDETRSLMILIRKLLEMMSQSEQSQFLILHLYCNWVAHIEITQSNTGLRILAEINDTLVDVKDSSDTTKIQTRMSEAIGFPALRKELRRFFQRFSVGETLVQDNSVWAVFLTNLFEIIKDVPLSFPPITKLDKTKRNIYSQIAKNPIKTGAGVISAKISSVTYPPPTNQTMCLVIKTEDTTTLVIPLLVDVRL